MLVTNLHTIPLAVLLVGIRAIAISSPSSTCRATIYSPPCTHRHILVAHLVTAIHWPPSGFTCRLRLSNIRSPQSTRRHRLSIRSLQNPLTAIHSPPPTGRHRIAAIHLPPSTLHHLLTVVHSPPSTLYHPLTAIHSPTCTRRHELADMHLPIWSRRRRHLLAAIQPPTTRRHPLTAIH